MARFRCRSCGQEGPCEYDGRHACPRCGSPEVQFALGIWELPDDDPMIEAMNRLAKDHDEIDLPARSTFACASCGETGEHPWNPECPPACPRCGSPDAVFTLSAVDIPDEVIEAVMDVQFRDDEDES